MKNPAHPGRIVRSACLEPLGLSVTEGAKILGVTRQTLTKIVNGGSGISAEMAIRLAKAFGGTAETWIRLQASYDLAQARKAEGKIKVRRQHLPQELHAGRIRVWRPKVRSMSRGCGAGRAREYCARRIHYVGPSRKKRAQDDDWN